MTPAIRRTLERAAAALEAGRADEAAEACREVLKHDANSADALYLLGRMAAMRGDHAMAADQLARAARGRGADPAVHFHLGISLSAAGRTAEALEAFRAAAAVNPTHAVIHSNIGTMLLRLNRPEEAAVAFESATLCDPRDAESHRYRAMALIDSRKFDDAVLAAERAAALAPRDPENRAVVATALARQGKTEAARASYEAALAIKPEYMSALLGLSRLATQQGKHGEAEDFARRAAEAAPGDMRGHQTLATALISAGKIAESLAVCEKIAQARQANARERIEALSAACMMRQYLDAFNGPKLARLTRECAEAIAAQAPRSSAPAPRIAPADGRPLRIGYVSPDFRRHSVSYFLQRVIEEHDRSAVNVICYAEVADPDPVTDWYRAAADSWRSTVGQGDAQIAQQIRDDKIDILVDLAGHSANNRLSLFATHPAPVQATWLGYPGTTGMKQIDWRISDAICDPPAEDALSAERVWRMEPGFHAWAPPYDARSISELPGRAGPLTFGSYSAIMKLSDATIALWSQVLAALPDARLVLKNGVAGDPPSCERLLARFAAQGLDPARVTIVAPQWNVLEHLDTYREIDVALDPTPYNGTTTICEGLWMGVPTITLTGDRHAARVGTSLMTQVGLPQFVARTPEHFVQIAVRCNEARARLAAIRAGLRERMAQSPLCDVQGFTRKLEDAYRAMWRERAIAGY